MIKYNILVHHLIQFLETNLKFNSHYLLALLA